MSTPTHTRAPVHVYRVHIRADAQSIWDALFRREWTERYGYRAPCEYELRPGGAYRALASDDMKAGGGPDVVVDGEVLEVDPPHRLVQTWHVLWDDEAAAEGARRLTYEIEEEGPGVCRVTLTHDVHDAPRTAALVAGDLPEFGGGWPQILSDLKTLLESGTSLYG